MQNAELTNVWFGDIICYSPIVYEKYMKQMPCFFEGWGPFKNESTSAGADVCSLSLVLVSIKGARRYQCILGGGGDTAQPRFTRLDNNDKKEKKL